MPKSSSASPTPELAQLRQVAPRGLRRALQHALLELEPQPPRRQPARAQAVRHQRRQVGLGELARGQVHSTIAGPSSPSPNAAALSWQACISVHAPISTISADSSATGMKSAGARHHAARASPSAAAPRGRRRAGRASADDRLEREPQLPQRQRPLQRRGRPQPLARVRAQPPVEDLHPPAALGLRAVGGGVGVGQQRVRVAPARGAQRDPDRRRQPVLDPVDLQRLVDRLGQAHARARSPCARRCPRRRRRTRRRRAARRCPPGGPWHQPPRRARSAARRPRRARRGR